WMAGDLSGREADLDAELDDLERWRVLSFVGRVLLGHRSPRVARVGVPIARDRRELDRRLSLCAPVRGFHPTGPRAAFRQSCLRPRRCRVSITLPRWRHAEE